MPRYAPPTRGAVALALALVALAGCGRTGLRSSRAHCPDAGPVTAACCAEEQTVCDGACRFLDTDPSNCGACGTRCAQHQVCARSQCLPLPLAGGSLHWCAVEDDGGVRCWGDGSHGELGTGAVSPSEATPRPVSGLPQAAVALALGSAHSCAATADGRVFCWGANDWGQLGDGTQESRLTPVAVVGLSGRAAALTAGLAFTCALLSTGEVQCWGDGRAGVLGRPGEKPSLVPLTIAGLEPPVVALAASAYTVCAIVSSGEVRCWGDNSFHQLGVAQPDTMSPTPIRTAGLDGAIALGAGWATHGALLSTGALSTWGDGIGSTPRISAGFSQAIADFDLAEYFVCATRTTGEVVCAGPNQDGELGDGSYQSSVMPVSVVSLEHGSTRLVCAGLNCCARQENGTVRCWGSNGVGQHGNGTTTKTNVPDVVKGLP